MKGIVSLLVLLAAFARTAWGDPPALQVSVDPRKLEEGKPTAISVTVKNAGETPLALVSVELALGPAKARNELTREARGMWLAPRIRGAVTSEMTLTEEVNPPMAAVAPSPPMVRGYGPEAFTVFRVLAPGDEATWSLEAWPLAGRDTAVEVRVLTCDPARLGSDLKPLLAAVSSESPSLTLPLYGLGGGAGEPGGPGGGPGGHGGPGGPGGAGADLEATVELAHRLWRAVDPITGPAGEVLADAQTAAAATVEARADKIAVEVAPAPFPSVQALEKAKAGADAVRRAAWLAEPALWAIDLADGAVLVLRDGDVRRYGGSLAPLVAELARTGKVSIECAPGSEAKLEKPLAAAGLNLEHEGKLSRFTIAPGTLRAALDVVERAGMTVQGMVVR